MMLTLVAGIVAAFLLLPWAETQTLGFVLRITASWYGAEHIETVRTVWRILLALLIFAVTSAGLRLVFSAASLAVAMRILSKARGR